MKRCPRCGVTKRHEDFNRSRTRADGLQGICRPCQTVQQREWYARHRAEHCERSRLGMRSLRAWRKVWSAREHRYADL